MSQRVWKLRPLAVASVSPLPCMAEPPSARPHQRCRAPRTARLGRGPPPPWATATTTVSLSRWRWPKGFLRACCWLGRSADHGRVRLFAAADLQSNIWAHKKQLQSRTQYNALQYNARGGGTRLSSTCHRSGPPGAVTLHRPPTRTTGAQLPQLAPLPVDRGRWWPGAS